jgi:hypothetical protein
MEPRKWSTLKSPMIDPSYEQEVSLITMNSDDEHSEAIWQSLKQSQ